MSSVSAQPGPCMTRLITSSAKLSPLRMSCGFSSEKLRKSGSTNAERREAAGVRIGEEPFDAADVGHVAGHPERVKADVNWRSRLNTSLVLCSGRPSEARWWRFRRCRYRR